MRTERRQGPRLGRPYAFPLLSLAVGEKHTVICTTPAERREARTRLANARSYLRRPEVACDAVFTIRTDPLTKHVEAIRTK